MKVDDPKSGIHFGSIDVNRTSKGIEVWAKLDPMVEELVQSAAEGQGSYTTPLETLGRQWRAMEPTPAIRCYQLERSLDSPTYTLSSICGTLKDSKNRTNLSFLLMAGIGSENGVRFLIVGPAQADAVKEYSQRVIKDVTNFLREYLVPVHIGINLTISDRF